MQLPLWFFWFLILLLAVLALLVWMLRGTVQEVWLITRKAVPPYRSRQELEAAYQTGSIPWDEYDRWRDRIR